MDNFIYTIDKNKNTESITELYCITGAEDFVDNFGQPRTKQDDDRVLAKHIKDIDNQSKFYIRIANTNKLFNPISILGNESSSTFLDNTCRSNNKFKQVNQKVFSYYLQFLSSKNMLWLNKAERELV